MDSLAILLLIFILSCAAASVFVPMLRNAGIKRRLYDDSGDDSLKIHKKPIPYTGGLGIFIGFLFGLAPAWFLGIISFKILCGILGGGVIVLLWGFWDDWKWKKDFNTAAKLASLIMIGLVVAGIMYLSGIALSVGYCALGGFGLVSLYVIGSMTSMNMEDGIDGLAAGLACVSLATFGFLSFIGGSLSLSAISVCLIGALIGFLIYNWNPASVFMGDSGSHFLGFVLAALAIGFSADPFQNIRQFIGPIFIIGLPVFDTAFAIFRRLVAGKSPFLGDRSHLYDRLMARGLSVKKTVVVCCIIQAVMVILGIAIYV